MIDCNTSLSITSEACLCATARYVAQYQAHYADRLAAVYVFGSIHRGEADACASDLDLILVTTDGFGQQDQEWELARWQEQERVQSAAETDYLRVGPTRASSLEQVLRGLQPGAEQQAVEARAVRLSVDQAALSAEEDAALRSGRLARALCYDATLVFGRDLVQGTLSPMMDAAWAALFFQAPATLIARTAMGAQVLDQGSMPSLPLLPDDSALRRRKMARLAVLGGACLLIARQEFVSFRALDVLPRLGRLFPKWATFTNLTGRLCVAATEASKADADDYFHELVCWMDFVGRSLEEQRAAEETK